METKNRHYNLLALEFATRITHIIANRFAVQNSQNGEIYENKLRTYQKGKIVVF